VLAAIQIGIICSSSRGDEWLERLMSEGPPQWARYEAMSKEIDVVVTTVYARYDTQGRPMDRLRRDKQESRVAANHDWILVQNRSIGKKASGESFDEIDIEAANSRYDFRLRRDKPDQSSYVITHIGEIDKPDRSHLTATLDNIQWAWRVNSKSVQDFWEKPGHKLIAASSEESSGHILVRMEAEESYQPPNAKQPRTITYSILLDPNDHWCIREFTAGVRSVDRSTTIITYGNQAEGLPVVQSLTYKHKTFADGSTFEVKSNVDKWERRRIPESEFTLSAFGLPEPKGVEWEKPSRRYLWIAAVALLALVLAFAFRQLGVRRKSSSA
jgi:hypothetical protein